MVNNAGPRFLTSLLNEKITIRPMGGGQPMTGILRSYNSYELLVEVNGTLHIVYKHAIHSIQILDVAKYNAASAMKASHRIE